MIIFLIIDLYRPHIASGSHLDLPRLSFNGQVRVDAATGNNMPCNFHPDEPIDKGWNFQGTGEFSLFNCRVMSAIGLDGEQPVDDAVINSAVVNNLDEPYAKAVDFDVQLMLTTVYGLTLAVVGVDGEVLIQGKVTPFVLGQDVWRRDIHITDGNTVRSCNPPDYCLSAKSASVISNLKWGKIFGSPSLQELKEASDQQGGTLSISLTIYSYISINPRKELNNETLAHLIGTIGPPSLNNPVLIAGERMLSYEGVPQPHLYDNSIQNGSRPNTLMYNAPFQIDHNSLRLTVDFSNSISLDVDGNFVNLGELWLGVRDQTLKCVHLISGPISYLDIGWVHKGCIHDHILSKNNYDHLLSSQLYVFEVRRGVTLKLSPTFDHSCSNEIIFLRPMLQEIEKFIRPMGNYLGQLEYKEAMKIDLKVTQYGWPLRDQSVYVYEHSSASPLNGIIVTPQISTTNEQGIATITFHAMNKIPLLRKFSAPETPCNRMELPIEGQLYSFEYSLSRAPTDNGTFKYANIIQKNNFIAILAFSYFKEPKHPNWVEHVQPIFQLYERLFPAMKHVVNLGNYIDVTSIRNLHLIDYTMGLDVNHPNYMPVTRDLSPSKRAMIQKWLRQKPVPSYSPIQNELDRAIEGKNADICIPLNVSHGKKDHEMSKPIFLPQRCLYCQSELEPSGFQHLYTQAYYLPNTINAHRRPLIKFGLTAQLDSCTLQTLREQLQTAIELEFYTIPVYLTSLYSIVDGCNQEIRKIIQYVVKQEMQHMTHAANILTAIGGHPVIDRSDVAPSYPAKGLPGGVLPNLVINLERLSREHVYKVLMGIEVPHDISVDTHNPIVFNNTIGQFYNEISECIGFLGDDIFISAEARKQVVWPWVDSFIGGSIHIITDSTAAKKAISEIIEQGEGASPLDPTVNHLPISEDNIAHFYKFEEIVCERHLVKKHGSYCYSGSLIPYNSSGVWPMQSNPSKDKIRPNTNCYTQAKAFHGIYRALLRILQVVLDGHSERIKDAIAVMESLGIHAHQVMQTRLHPHEETTCGPVWDYNWD